MQRLFFRPRRSSQFFGQKYGTVSTSIESDPEAHAVGEKMLRLPLVVELESGCVVKTMYKYIYICMYVYRYIILVYHSISIYTKIGQSLKSSRKNDMVEKTSRFQILHGHGRGEE